MTKAYCSRHYCMYEQASGCLDCRAPSSTTASVPTEWPIVDIIDSDNYVWTRLPDHLVQALQGPSGLVAYYFDAMATTVPVLDSHVLDRADCVISRFYNTTVSFTKRGGIYVDEPQIQLALDEFIQLYHMSSVLFCLRAGNKIECVPLYIPGVT